MHTKDQQRRRRHGRIRKRLSGTVAKPRVVVYRSLGAVYAQAVNDESGLVIAQASDLKAKTAGTKVQRAKEVGMILGKKLVEKKISHIAFDRAGYKYHGRIKALAEGIREAGITF